VRDYSPDLDARGSNRRAMARRLSAMRHLFRFLLSERFRSDDPAAILPGPKRGRGLPKCVDIDVDRLLVRAEGAGRSAGSPLRRIGFAPCGCTCLLEVLIPPGLRVSELVSCRSRRRVATPA